MVVNDHRLLVYQHYIQVRGDFLQQAVKAESIPIKGRQLFQNCFGTLLKWDLL